MKTLFAVLALMFFSFSLSIAQRDYSVKFIIITFSNPPAPSYVDTFGVGVGYTFCMDKGSNLPYLETEQPPPPPLGNTDARFVDFSGTDPDVNCHGAGVKTDIQGWSGYSTIDTFQYQIQVADKNNPWYITWDTTGFTNKISSLVIQDAGTGGLLLNLDMTTKDSIIITKTSWLKNTTQFYIYAEWKGCMDCYWDPILSLNLKTIDFGKVEIGEYKDTVITIRNTGDAPLLISSIASTSSYFSISGDVRSIAAGNSANYTIRFTPANSEPVSGWIVIGSYSYTSPDSVYLLGNQVAGVRDHQLLPGYFALHQNYPNPFNPSTLIEYDLPSREYVSLRVYNMLGQEVAVLVNGEQEPGYKSVKFDITNLPSGVYVYRIAAGSFTDTKKMLIVK
jgi:hypothetical protein